MTSKADWRARARQANRELDRGARHLQAALVAARLEPWLRQRPGPVALYAAMAFELPTGPIDDLLRADGRDRYVPDIEGPTMIFRRLPADVSVRDLRRPRSGPAVPDPSWPALDATALGALVVPGLWFDVEGHRLGRGAGFYDRALADVARKRTVGVGFAHQRTTDRLPTEPHDVPVGAVCTPDGLWHHAGTP